MLKKTQISELKNKIFTKHNEIILKKCSPEVMIADLIADGLQSGWSALTRPAMPET